MILSKKTIEHFQSLSSLVIKGMKGKDTKYPYEIPNNLFLRTYECLRLVWVDNVPVKKACARFSITRTAYYIKEKDFIKYGVSGLFSLPHNSKQFNNLEELLLLTKKARPALSYTALHRLVEAVPLTQGQSSIEKDVKGNKFSLQKMRNLLLEKRNCTLGVMPSGNLCLTFFDSPNSLLMYQVSKMFENLKRKGKNKVLWWDQRGLEVKFKNQFSFCKFLRQSVQKFCPGGVLSEGGFPLMISTDFGGIDNQKLHYIDF